MEEKYVYTQVKKDGEVLEAKIEKVRDGFDYDEPDVIEDTDFFGDKHTEDEFD